MDAVSTHISMQYVLYEEFPDEADPFFDSMTNVSEKLGEKLMGSIYFLGDILLCALAGIREYVLF